jgi:hypothetical protein
MSIVYQWIVRVETNVASTMISNVYDMSVLKMSDQQDVPVDRDVVVLEAFSIDDENVF